MECHFKIISDSDLKLILPLVYDLNEGQIEMAVLESRFNEMKSQNYECAVIFFEKEIIGVAGLWFCTRHYAGKSVELDHVFIKPKYRNNGLGKRFMAWISEYVVKKGCQSIELNTYVQNHNSHKFYYNEGYEILGYHFLKKL